MGGGYARRPPKEPVRLIRTVSDEADIQADHPTRAPAAVGGVFGRRAGRRLRTGQASLMRELLPQLEIDLQAARRPANLFPDASELRLEIGFGGGEHLAYHARQRADAGFIGCEPFRNGVAKFLERARADALPNVRIYAGDAGDLIGCLPDASLAGVDLFYPDPWPKRRQHKRRFVSDTMLARLSRVMIEGAVLRFATDIDDYAGWTLARVLRSPHFRWDARTESDWTDPWPGWPSTRYEAKALKEGRRSVYLTFRRTALSSG